MKLFNEKELRKKSYYELYQIALNEKLIEVYLDNTSREELINIILKYRGISEDYSIKKYNELGFFNLQNLFDSSLNNIIHNENKIKIPHKILMYKSLNITREDKYKIILPDEIGNYNVFLMNSNNYLCGIFQLEKDLKSKDSYYLIAEKEFFRLEELKNNNFYLIFFKKEDFKIISKFYNKKENEELLNPYQLNYYKVNIENLEIRELETTNTVLCIDFGTYNTALGAYLDSNYISELPTNYILNGNIKINSINYVKFDDCNDNYREIIPSVVYVLDCSKKDDIKYLFGYDAINSLEKNNYLLNGSLFYGIKRWVHNHNQEEKITDELGNIRYVKRKEIIKAYLNFIVERAEYLFKCKFYKIHASSPVKLKEQFLNMFEEIFEENDKKYNIVRKDSMDEAVAVLYNTIENQILKEKYKDGEEYSALIIDCGGGTTDLAACKYIINKGSVSYNLNIKTSFENGDENFGGNNLTYRIMQFLKVILAYKYRNKSITIDDLIHYDSSVLYKIIDEHGTEKLFEKLVCEYEKSEKIIPTKYSKFENKMNDEYKKVKNNFYMLWEASEQLKKEFFTKDGRIRTKFSLNSYIDKQNEKEKSDLHSTMLKSWNLHVYDEQNIFYKIEQFPNNIFTIREIEKIVKIEIYGMLRKFLNTYYKEGILFEYSLIKLSGQSTKINTFQEVLKEFVPGKMIEYKDLEDRDNYQLKLNCLDGAIKYLNYKKFGHMDVKMENKVPLVPYSVYTESYTGEKIKMLKTSRKASVIVNYIDKRDSALELKIYVHNAEDELKKELIYKNEKGYIELDSKDIIEKYGGIITQNETDSIPNNIVRFFIYTDVNNWGFYVLSIKRKNDQLYVGSNKYYSYENSLEEVVYFDGEH